MRGSVVQRNGKWTYILDEGRDPITGKRRQRWIGGHRTKKEAESALTVALSLMQKGEYVAPSRLTVAEFFNDWLLSIQANVRPTTHGTYEWAVRKHIIPHLGSARLQDLTPLRLNAFYGQLVSQGAAPQTVNYIHVVLRKALGDALNWGQIVRNPAQGVRRPTRTAAKEMRVWTANQLRQFLEFIKGDRLGTAYLLLATTGMRRGEALGLRWKDVNLQEGWVQVQRNLVLTKAGLHFTQPKTLKSRRLVALDEITLGALFEQRLTTVQERHALGLPAPDDEALIFSQPDGEPINPNTLSSYFGRRVAALGLPHLSLHGLRHTHATMALQAGIHPKVVQERLGHSNIAMTLNTYSHAIPALQADAASKVSGLIFAPE